MLVDKRNDRICPNSFCRRDFSVSGSLCFFVEVPMVEQLRKLFSKSGFYQDIQHRHNRDSKTNRICDIYDGELYKKLSKYPNVLSCPQNMSFTWNTDEVPVFILNHQTFHCGLYTWLSMNCLPRNASQKTA